MSTQSAKVSPCPAPTAQLSPGSGGENKDDDTVFGSIETGLQDAGRGSKTCRSRCPLPALCRGAAGLLLAGGVAWSWAWSAHYAKDTLTKLHSPFFITWFCSLWNLLSFPLYYLGHTLGSQLRQRPCTELRVCGRSLGDTQLSGRVLLKTAAPFSLIRGASCVMHLMALHRISISDSSAVLCCSKAFVFLLSWIGLQDRFMGVRIVAAILSITGIVMMAYADGFHSDSITGVALGVGSASTSAFYKVLLWKRVGPGQPGTASLLMSCEGLCGVGLHSWIWVLLHLSHFESWPSLQLVPWDTLCLTASLLLAFNVLVNVGEVLTYPTLISVGILFTIPASAALDLFMSSALQLSHVRAAACSVIAAGYLMLLLPENWDERTARAFGALWHGNEERVLGHELEPDNAGSARPKPKQTGVAALP
ncbi:solute carrier family 35 member F4 [Brachyhypopomus gauderio]|uniref:solute carrier family 35 member F4 n=1 Tax=Brachyhypopomus gauderio TaxID=698409 RepID=UPI004042FF96